MKRMLFPAVIALCVQSFGVTAAGPRSWKVNGGGRRWEKQVIRVGWTGDLPLHLTAADADQIVAQAFDFWTLSGVPLQFTYDSDLGEVLRLGERFPMERFQADIRVIFTKDLKRVEPEQPVPERIDPKKYATLADTYELELKNPLPSELGTTLIVVDNNLVDTRETLFATLVHEAGHSLGLAHTSVNYVEDVDSRNIPDLPIMTPVISHLFRTRFHADDRSSVAVLYQAGPTQDYGRIVGTVIDAVDTRIKINGVDVLAVRKTDPATGMDPSPTQRFSCITPYGHIANPNAQGHFELAVPPGRYDVTCATLPLGYPLLEPRRREPRNLTGTLEVTVLPNEVSNVTCMAR